MIRIRHNQIAMLGAFGALGCLAAALTGTLRAPVRAMQMGEVHFSHATATVKQVRGNVYLLQVRAGKGDDSSISNIGVLAGGDGYLLVDHPEAASGPVIRKALEDFMRERDERGALRVRFLVNTHWHYDHVGGNELYGPETVIVAHENVRKRLTTQQKPFWSPTPIGPYPERADLYRERSPLFHVERSTHQGVCGFGMLHVEQLSLPRN